MTDFSLHVDGDVIRVRFVGRKALGRLPSGHGIGGDYEAKLIRLPRWYPRRSVRSLFMHELGHYFVEREEMRGRGKALVDGTTEEEVVDLFTWLPDVLVDPRNADLRKFLGLSA